MLVNFQAQFTGRVLAGLYSDEDSDATLRTYLHRKLFEQNTAKLRKRLGYTWSETHGYIEKFLNKLPDDTWDESGKLLNCVPKTQTIRKYRSDKKLFQVGMDLQLYYGLRTSKVMFLGEVCCADAPHITMDVRDKENPVIKVGHFNRLNLIPENTHEVFARLDGFGSFADMRQWLMDNHEGYLEGQIITWFHSRPYERPYWALFKS